MGDDMFEWKVEELRLLNDKSTEKENGRRIYSFERGVSKEDKIEFIDKMNDGKLSYILDLVEKFENEKENLPKDSYGNVKTVSLKAWLKRNDTKNLIDKTHRHGMITFFVSRDIQHINTIRVWDNFENYIDEIFNRQLNDCEVLEEKYFLDHDEYSILKGKWRNYLSKYNTSFGIYILHTGEDMYIRNKEDSQLYREITMDELKYLISKYEELDKMVEKFGKEVCVKIKY